MKVMDGSGESTQLRITVRSRRQYTMTKMDFEYGISDGAPTELLDDVSEELSNRPWLENTGYYVLVPDKECSNFLEKGVLEIYRTGKEDKPLVGRLTRFRWRMRTGIHTHCGSLPVMESRGSLHGLSRGMKVAVWSNVYLQKM